MEYVVKGRIRDSEGKQLSGISVNAYDKDPVSDDLLGSSLTDNDGHFEIAFSEKDFDRFHIEGEPEVYLKINDTNESFKSVKDKQESYTKDDRSGNITWNSSVINSINDIDKYDITIVVQPRKIPDKYETVVIGSGFGGTITSLTLANMYSKKESSGKNNNDGPEINVPDFNVYPGRSQTQNIEITSNRSETITIKNITFSPQPSGLSFKVNDPKYTDKRAKFPLELNLLPNTTSNIPLTLSLDANQQLVDVDLDVEIPLTREQNPTTTITLSVKNLHIGHKRVCLLERGQWWVSHEMPATSDGLIGTNPSTTIRQYLEQNNIPYNIWVYPDNTKGLLRFFGTIRIFDNIKGLYDYKVMQNVHVVTAAGIGGGSLVYFNITERAERSVYQSWPTETGDPKLSINNYYSPAESFIGTNAITTTTSNGNFMLLRAKAFQNAAKMIQLEQDNILNTQRKDTQGKPITASNGKPILDFDARLSITEIEPQILFSKGGPLGLEKKLEDMSQQELRETFSKFFNKYKKETNVCQRQGRCGLGCIPGARHTLNKQIYKAISDGKPLDVFPLCKVDHIEHTDNNDSDYKYRIILKDYRDLDDGIDEVINAKQVILSAGTLGSTEILLKSKNLDLSNKLGANFSTNGDTFGLVSRTKENVDSSRGPMMTSIAKFKNKETGIFEFSIEDLGIPKMFAGILPIMFNLMALQKKAGSLSPQINLINMVRQKILPTINKSNTRQLISRLLADLHVSPERIAEEIVEILTKMDELALDKKSREESLREQSLDERVRNIMLLFGIGLDNANGNLTINKKNNELDLVNEYELNDDNQPIIKSITDMMKLFAKQIGQNGEDSLIIPFWDSKNNRQEITAHPLGGCPMGKDVTTGVVNSFGQVFRGQSGNNVYEDLYVVDGSIIPTPLGVNPSLTISALAFRASEHITGSKNYWPP